LESRTETLVDLRPRSKAALCFTNVPFLEKSMARKTRFPASINDHFKGPQLAIFTIFSITQAKGLPLEVALMGIGAITILGVALVMRR
jgi:hypothetical protein